MVKKKISKKWKIFYIILGSIIVLYLALTIALPYYLLKYVNRQLTLIDGYSGHVDDIDVDLWRGAYTIKSINLDKTGGKIPVPFFAARIIDLSVEWRALLNGKVVAEIEVEKPVLNFVKGPTKSTTQTSIDKDWTVVIDRLIPFKLNRFQINDGEIHYRDFHSSPKVDILAKDVQILAENLSNAKHKKDSLPSTVKGSASVYDGTARIDMRIDPLNAAPTFDMNARLTTLSLRRFNDFLKAYGNFDVEKGTISLYTEAAAKDNRIRGYTKPVIKDLQVLSLKKDDENPLQLLWESIVEAIGAVLNNPKKDQIATRVSFEGNVKDPDINTWSIIGTLLRNAFIQALYPSLENSINLNSVEKKEEKKTFLQKIFEGSKDENKDKKKEKEKEIEKGKKEEKKKDDKKETK